MELFAVIGEEIATGEVGLVAAVLSHQAGPPLPLICFKESNVPKLIELAKRAPLHRKKHVVRFQAVETIEEIP